MKIGQLLRTKRKEKKLTIQEVATQLNVSYGAVAEWERDMIEPRADAREKLCNFYGLSEKELLGFTGGKVLDISTLPRTTVFTLDYDSDEITIKGLKGKYQVKIIPL